LAAQATKCLSDQTEMLLEYFAIKLEMKQDPGSQSDEQVLMLSGLPIILEGHAPSPHGLPTFLHRLATETDWTEERPCFEGVCTELGRYYAEIPIPDPDVLSEEKSDTKKMELISEEEKKFVQHTLFPALRFLLVVPEELATDGSFCKLAVLSKLYKIFERC
jgi:DNA mismatch repair protein MLH1